MNIDTLTFGQAKEIAKFFAGEKKGRTQSHSFEVGKAYLIRTVTMIQTGRVTAVTDSDIALTNAAWIADTGRFSHALRTGQLNEVEPFPNGCYVSRAAIVDFTPWHHDLPQETK